MPEFSVQKIPKKEQNSPDYSLERFCYHYNQYTYQQAQRMPYKRVVQMLDKADEIEAKKLFNLANILYAQHTEGGKGMKEMLKSLQDIIEEF